MAEAKINESCIIGLPTCGYAFNSSRMAFIATPTDEEFALELNVLENLLKDKEYESYIALQKLDPAKLAFCTKICSKIITSQFCVVLLNPSSHKDHKEIKIPNPNVHLEYGLMMAFKKHILPFQLETEALAFNIHPLDTIKYTKSNFKEKADSTIDEAIISTGTTSRPTRALTSSDNLIKYTSVLGLRVTELNSEEANYLYRMGKPMGYLLLDGQDIVYLGLFDLESAKEVVFRLKLLLQSLHNTKKQFEDSKKQRTQEQIDQANAVWNKLRVEVLVSTDLDKDKITKRVNELTSEYETIPWKLVDDNDIKKVIDKAYEDIGEI